MPTLYLTEEYSLVRRESEDVLLVQYRAHQDMVKRCELARRFVMGKLTNQRQRLLRYNRAQFDREVSQAIDQLAASINTLNAPGEPLAWSL